MKQDVAQEARMSILDGLQTLVAVGKITKDTMNYYVEQLDELFVNDAPKKRKVKV